MTNEELEKLRKKYKDLNLLRRTVELLLEEKKRLESDPKIKRYCEINRLLDKFCVFNGIEKESDNKIIERTINLVKLSDIKNIYVYIGTFKCNNIYDIIHGPGDTRVNRNDRKATYSLYRNLESCSSDDNYEIKIGVKKREKFESENIVIYPPKNTSSDQFYTDLRIAYFKQVIENGPEEAFEKILHKINNKK